MTVAEVDALLYLPGHPRQQLLRALRIPALSPGWQASFQALVDGEPGAGNARLVGARQQPAFQALDAGERGAGTAGVVVASPPPAWPGFRRLTVAGLERESGSVLSI